MLSEQLLSFEKHDVAMIAYKGQAWFRASDVTTVLEYKKSATSVRSHVNAKYVRTLTELQLEASGPNALNPGIHFERSGKPPLYINESGIYELVWQSKKKEALRFRAWILEEVIPEIRKTGRFVQNEQVSLMCETNLHYKVIDFIRKFFVEAIVIPGLGELQDTDPKKLDAWSKGYKAGQPDILILNRTRKTSGLAIELKTPYCHSEASQKQDIFLQSLRNIKYETLLSNCYDEIVVKIIEYREAARRCNPVRKARSSVE